jgi:hypothetical protein
MLYAMPYGPYAMPYAMEAAPYALSNIWALMQYAMPPYAGCNALLNQVQLGGLCVCKPGFIPALPNGGSNPYCVKGVQINLPCGGQC